MNARELVAALGGRGYMAQCPSHDDHNPSLAVRDGEGGAILFHCHAGCSQRDVLEALKERRLWATGQQELSLSTPTPDKDYGQTARRQARARAIWQAAQPASGTAVEKYLRARGIVMPPPPSLRYSSALRHGYTGLDFPGMVAAVTDESGAIVAVHRTFLSASGGGKASVNQPKMCLGPLGNGAVRLAPAGPVLGLAEGIETALSAMQLFHLPVWVTLSASRLDRIALPDIVRHVIIYADAGTPGLVAAHRAVQAFTRQRRKVTLEPPPEGYSDWNEVLQRRTAA